jgi:hypothetical protein
MTMAGIGHYKSRSGDWQPTGHTAKMGRINSSIQCLVRVVYEVKKKGVTEYNSAWATVLILHFLCLHSSINHTIKPLDRIFQTSLQRVLSVLSPTASLPD